MVEPANRTAAVTAVGILFVAIAVIYFVLAARAAFAGHPHMIVGIAYSLIMIVSFGYCGAAMIRRWRGYRTTGRILAWVMIVIAAFGGFSRLVEAGVSELSLPLAMLVLFGLTLWTLHRERPSS